MRKITFQFIISILCLLAVEILQGQHIEYYSSLPLRESPYPRYKGISSLGREEALTRNHYRFEFDAQNRVISVSFWHQNTRINPNHTANYFFQSSVQRVSYQENKEVITFYDRFNRPVTLPDGVRREIYTLDDRGKRVGLHFEDENGGKVENRWNISDYKWQVQLDGSVVENRTNMAGEAQRLRPGFPFHRIRLYYEANGILALMQNVDDDLNPINNETGVAQDRLQFDDEGVWLGWNVLDAENQLKEGNGPNVAKGINVPDEYGYETMVKYEDRHGNALKGSYGFWRGRRAYDRYGNYDITWFEDQYGQPAMNDRHNYCYSDYTWDDQGLNLLSIAYLDDKRQPVLRRGGYHKQIREYIHNGLLIKVTYLGLDGNPVNRSDNGVAYMEFEYDDAKNRIATKRFDKDGREL